MTKTAQRTSTFNESVIREMTRIAHRTGAVNLAQGFPDFPMPAPMKDAACAAIMGDVNQYAITWGSPALRIAIAEKYRRWYGMQVDPDTEITVTCGATEAMAATFMALIDPGDEVIIAGAQHTAQSYGESVLARGDIGNRRAGGTTQFSRVHGRDLRASRLRRSSSPDRDLAWNAGAHSYDIGTVENVLLHRMASGIRHRTA